MLLGLNEKPAPATTVFVAFQHLLAVLGGIVTAPLLIARGMGLSDVETAYLISSSLVISGVATVIQVSRFGVLGSGLLSIQGTSFAFIGPLIYVFSLHADSQSLEEVFGLIFTSCGVCALLMAGISQFVHRLKSIITANVAGATIVLLGITLIWATLKNLWFAFQQKSGESAWQIPLLALFVFSLILLLSRSPRPMIRLSCIVIGLATGLVIATSLGQVDFRALETAGDIFLPELGRFSLNFDLSVILLLLPIFLISATESIGDLSATATLSGLKITDKSFWQRIRGGILADSVNSLMAALFATFPNTTFSQNNGVIRITGVCSRRIGLVVGIFLVVVGCIPVVAGFFQILPPAVLYGATLLMFFMVAVSGFHIVLAGRPRQRDWWVVGGGVIGGLLLSWLAPQLTLLPQGIINIIGFPVSSGAFLAMLLELSVPKTLENTS